MMGNRAEKMESKLVLEGINRTKLEYLLAEAERTHADAIITRGGTGSNFALAAAAYAKQAGIVKRILVLPIRQIHTLFKEIYCSWA